jgi:hypothetical protein
VVVVADSTSTAQDRKVLAVCEVCAFAKSNGWWGSTIPAGHTHCRDCHATFPGSNRWGHCSACHRTFSGAKSFDLHQRVTKEGEIAADCLCAVSDTLPVPDTAHGHPSSRKWAVGSCLLIEKRTVWGAYWGQAAPEAFKKSEVPS